LCQALLQGLAFLYMEEIMSSFLDSTGLSRLVSKITDYFAKKDGTYSNMTVGTAQNYDTSTGTIKTALNGFARNAGNR